jgi:hypothetical protein
MENLPAEDGFQNLSPPYLRENDLAMDVLYAGIEASENVPIIFVNEPMFISEGENSDIRYNFYYPRWAYDQYRQIIAHHCKVNNWYCLDMWDSISPDEFTNSAVHLSVRGSAQLAKYLQEVIKQVASNSN